jgi:hypothetical protein
MTGGERCGVLGALNDGSNHGAEVELQGSSALEAKNQRGGNGG